MDSNALKIRVVKTKQRLIQVKNSITGKKKFLTLDWNEYKEGASQMKAFSLLKKTGKQGLASHPQTKA